MNAKERKEQGFELLFCRARLAGLEAGNATACVPMIVGSPSTPFGNDIDPKQPTYYVPDGVCGFAWVSVRPGYSPFAKWLVKTERGSADSYAGGVKIWVRDFGQSMARKEDYASAFAKVLADAGIPASSGSRID